MSWSKSVKQKERKKQQMNEPDISRESSVQATEKSVVELAKNAEEAATRAEAHSTKTDKLLEYAVTTAAEGLVKSAQTSADTAAILSKFARSLDSVQRAVRISLMLVVLVSVGVAISAISLLRYTVPNSKLLVECTTPSTPGHAHKCADNNARSGFSLSTAIVKCEKNLPTLVHTVDVTSCLYESLGITPQYSPAK